MDLHPANEGRLIGRVMSEALPNGITPKAVAGTFVSKPAANGLKTVVKYQRVLAQRYFDAAGFPGRTVGLDAESGKQKTAGAGTRRLSMRPSRADTQTLSSSV